MNDYDTDDELVYDENVDKMNTNSGSESFVPIIINSVNTTPVNNIDDFSPTTSLKNHKHNYSCYSAEVIVSAVSLVLKNRIKNCSPSDVPVDRKFLNLISIDDGYQEDNPSPIMSSDCSDRDQMTLSDASSEGFYCQTESNHTSNEAIYSHIVPYIKKLKKHFPLPNNDTCPMLPKFNEKFYKSLEILIQSFEDKFHSESSDWLRSNASQLNKMDIIQAGSELNKILESIFSEKINWSRIIAMIGFVCELSFSAFMIEKQYLIDEYIMTTIRFIDQQLWIWISQHGGWEGLMEFQAGQNSGNAELENIFSSLTRIARVAAFALAGVAFCKYVADHI